MTTRRKTMWTVPVLVGLVAGCAQQAAPADPDDVAAAAAGWGIPADVVLTTAVEGFTPAPGGAGAYGSDGFSVVLTNPSDGQIMMLAATHDTMTEQSCPGTPIASASGGVEGQVVCSVEDKMFYRSTVGATEYAVLRVPSQDDLAAMEPPDPAGGAGGPGAGVERGDLPPGDGAPDNSVGLGG